MRGPLPATLPDPSCLTLDDVDHQGGILKVTVTASADEATCPGCGTRSRRVHSRYCRTLRDLPCHGQIVRICLRTHRFYCRVRDCRCRIFTQRLPLVASPYARQTRRHHDALLAIGYALGGEPGSRLAICLGIQSSADTILRIIGQTPLLNRLTM